jgi:hypothetical protein
MKPCIRPNCLRSVENELHTWKSQRHPLMKTAKMSHGNDTVETVRTRRTRRRCLQGSLDSTEHTMYEGGQTVRSNGQLSANAHCYDTPPPSPQLNGRMLEDIERNDNLDSCSATRENLSRGDVAQADTSEKSEALMYGNR